MAGRFAPVANHTPKRDLRGLVKLNDWTVRWNTVAADGWKTKRFWRAGRTVITAVRLTYGRCRILRRPKKPADHKRRGAADQMPATGRSGLQMSGQRVASMYILTLTGEPAITLKSPRSPRFSNFGGSDFSFVRNHLMPLKYADVVVPAESRNA